MKQKKGSTASTSENSDNVVSVGVIGSGRMGTIHVESLALYVPRGLLAAITSKGIREVKKFAQKYSVLAVVDDYHKFLEDRRIQAVVISAPSQMHTRMIQDAAHAGKHGG